MLFINYFTQQFVVKIPAHINLCTECQRQIAYFSGALHVIALLLLDQLSSFICQMKELTLIYMNTFVLKAYLVFEICMQVASVLLERVTGWPQDLILTEQSCVLV